jgi:hypothetical protein
MKNLQTIIAQGNQFEFVDVQPLHCIVKNHAQVLVCLLQYNPRNSANPAIAFRYTAKTHDVLRHPPQHFP